jgi:hypothetical protein
MAGECPPKGLGDFDLSSLALCIDYFCLAVTKTPNRNNLRKDLLGLTVSEGSVHHGCENMAEQNISFHGSQEVEKGIQEESRVRYRTLHTLNDLIPPTRPQLLLFMPPKNGPYCEPIKGLIH